MERNAESVIFPNDIIGIKIRILESQMFPFRVHRQISVRELKEEVFRVIPVPVSHQHLSYTGNALSDQDRLACYNVQDGDTIDLHLDLNALSPPSSPDHPTDQGPANHHSSSVQQNVDTNQMVPDAMSALVQELSHIRHFYLDHHNGMTSATPAISSDERLFPPLATTSPEALASLLTATPPMLHNLVNSLKALSWYIAVQPRVSDLDERWLIQSNAWTVGSELHDVGMYLVELGRVTSNLVIKAHVPEASLSTEPTVNLAHLFRGPAPADQPTEPRGHFHPGSSSGQGANPGPSTNNAAAEATPYRPNAS